MFNYALPPIQTYDARDGRSLCYRHYPAKSDKLIVLLHGISEDGQYLHRLAEYLSKQQLAQVVVPDLRGYGLHPVRRGDVEYIGQHDDDLEDLAQALRSRAEAPFQLIMAGHSGGGGNVVRLALKPIAKLIRAYLLFAPSIHPEAPINHKKDPGSTLHFHKQKLALLTILNKVGIRLFNHWIVMNNDKPPAKRHGRETLELSYRLMASRVPSNAYVRNLQAMKQPTLVLVGEREEVFIPGQYEPLFAEHNKAQVRMIPNADHDGVLEDEGTFLEVKQWLLGLA